MIAILVAVVAQLAAILILVVVSVQRWTEIKKWLPRGIVVAIVVLCLELPGWIVKLWHFEPRTVIGRMFESEPELVTPVIITGITGLFVVWVASLFLVACSFAASVLLSPDRSRIFPLSIGGKLHVRELLVSVAVGFCAAVLTMISVQVFGLQSTSQPSPLFPDLDTTQGLFLVCCIMPKGIAHAIKEELLYRGVVWGAVGARFSVKNRTVGALVASTVLWVVSHLANSDTVVIHTMHILVLGTALAALRVRSSLEASVVCHASYNVSIVLSNVG